MIAPWIPVTVVPTSSATVAIETFITELSSVIRNWPDASVSSTTIAAPPRDRSTQTQVCSRRDPLAIRRRNEKQALAPGGGELVEDGDHELPEALDGRDADALVR